MSASLFHQGFLDAMRDGASETWRLVAPVECGDDWADVVTLGSIVDLRALAFVGSPEVRVVENGAVVVTISPGLSSVLSETFETALTATIQVRRATSGQPASVLVGAILE